MGQQPTDSLFVNDDENLETMTARYHFLCVVIITSYNAQRALYLGVIKSTTSELNLPRVATIDSMQGHESGFVLLDWVIGVVVSWYFVHMPHSLFSSILSFSGVLEDNRRINVALTRPHAVIRLQASNELID